MEQTHLQKLLREKNLKLADLARAFGVEKSSVTWWSKNKIPAERVLEVERVTGIDRHLLRPDIYPAEEAMQ